MNEGLLQIETIEMSEIKMIELLNGAIPKATESSKIGTIIDQKIFVLLKITTPRVVR
jgi:hypothetical protein